MRVSVSVSVFVCVLTCVCVAPRMRTQVYRMIVADPVSDKSRSMLESLLQVRQQRAVWREGCVCVCVKREAGRLRARPYGCVCTSS